MKSNRPFLFLSSLSFLEGIVVFILVISRKSMEKNAWIFGLSPERLTLGVVLGLSILFFGFLFWGALTGSSLYRKLNSRVSHLSEKSYLGLLTTGLTIFFIVIELIVLLPSSGVYQGSNVVLVVYEILTPGLIWLLLIIIQAVIYVTNQTQIHWNRLWKNDESRNLIFVYFILQFVLFYWIILITQSPLLSSIPNWFGRFNLKSIGHRHLYLIPFLVLVWFGIQVVFSKSGIRKSGIIALVIIGYAAQVLFGFIDGEGFESVRKSYSDAPISTTVSYACSRMDISDSIRNYEKFHGADFWVQTKPPGFLAGHMLFAKFVNLVAHPESSSECKYAYTQLAAFLFPLFASLVILPITYLSDKLFKLRYPLLPGLLYILAPNFMLWVLVPDQVVFPLVFVLNCLLFYLTIKNRSFILAGLTGIIGYLSIFLSFSMLPLLGLFLIWLVIDYLINKEPWEVSRVIALVFGFILGFLITYLIFDFALNYNALTRYQLAFSHHRQIKDYEFSITSILDAFFLNTIEYFAWTGIPFLFLAARYGFRSFRAIIGKIGESRFIFSVSVVALYFAINVLSQTHGEVQRLWIFLSPTVVLLSAADLEERFTANQKVVVYALLVLQTTTALFHYQFL